eukprot:6236147-Alexandrium_andersonii.AAC.1
MSRACLARVSRMSRACLAHVSHMPRTCLAHVSHMSRACLAHVAHMSRRCLAMFRTSGGDIFEIRSTGVFAHAIPRKRVISVVVCAIPSIA